VAAQRRRRPPARPRERARAAILAPCPFLILSVPLVLPEKEVDPNAVLKKLYPHKTFVCSARGLKDNAVTRGPPPARARKANYPAISSFSYKRMRTRQNLAKLRPRNNALLFFISTPKHFDLPTGRDVLNTSATTQQIDLCKERGVERTGSPRGGSKACPKSAGQGRRGQATPSEIITFQRPG
jgi:hypothetical protein